MCPYPKTVIMKLIPSGLGMVALVTALIALSLSIAAADGVGKDMQAVPSGQSSLKPKPIETLSRADSRKQPKPADPVNIKPTWGQE